MQFKRFIAFPVVLIINSLAAAQNIYPVESQYNGFRQNTVSVMAAAGDTLWIGPSLDFNVNNQAGWEHPSEIDSIHLGGGRVFSLAVDGSRIAAGLGKNIELSGEEVPSGFGYYFSENNGLDWNYSPFYSDDEPDEDCDSKVLPYDGSCDIEFIYGGKSYFRIRNTVSQQSPPYSTAIKENVVFSAGWASGLQRSSDFGHSWEKIILPPMRADSLSPHKEYEWNSSYQGETILRYDPRSDINLLGFGVLIDSSNRVWFGSAGGVNISDNALSATTDSISWRHLYFNGTDNGLLGNWVVAIRENPDDGSVWMTNWTSDSENREVYGLVSTSDGGNTFKQHLQGHKINDIGFFNNTIYAAGETGLFISYDDGSSWIKMPQIRGNSSVLKDNTEFFTAAATPDRMWIGTSDGIISTDNDGTDWEISRVDFPLSGGNKYAPDAKNVETYAYPNPYSPVLHSLVRIKFDVKKAGRTNICIFDYGMNLVRELAGEELLPGKHETDWDGLDSNGYKASNGVYFYVIEMPDRTVNGKILLVE